MSSYAEAPAAYVQPAVDVQPAAYVQPAVQPAYLSHQYIHPQPTVFAAEYSQLPVSDFYATDYQGYNSYLAPTAPVATHTVTHSNYAAPPAAVAAPVAVAAAAPHAVAAAPHAVAAAAPVAVAAAPRAVAAAPVSIASHGDYQSVSPVSTKRETTTSTATTSNMSLATFNRSSANTT